MKRIIPFFLTLLLLAGCAANPSAETTQPSTDITAPAATTTPNPSIDKPDVVQITLSDGDTTWKLPEGMAEDAITLSNDIIYYEDRDTYESGNTYGEGTAADRHTQEEAEAHTVVNITQPGTYRLSGTLSQGQIRVDLGKDASEDPNAVVTLILSNADITCTVAPAILFLSVYECDNQWSTETAAATVDTSAAGSNLILEDGTVNNVSGSYVAKIYKDNDEQKKLYKQDGAIYSYMSMNVDGGGTLNLAAANEGLDTELHLTINGGNISILADNDGINTNEDGVSVTTINGGILHIVAGLGAEGDGIDSNGYLVINGGTIISSANPKSDAGLDSDLGSYVNGGTVVALGSTMDWAESDSQQVTMNLQFAAYRDSGDAIVVTKEDGTLVFAYDPSEDELMSGNQRSYMGAVISCPEFQVGETYEVFLGGTVTGTETGGVYDISTITAFSNGIQQCYTGTDVGMGRPGGIGGKPDGMGGRPGEMSSKSDGQQSPEGEFSDQERPEMPEGGFEFDGQEPPKGEGFTRPDGSAPDREPPEGDGFLRPNGDNPNSGSTDGLVNTQFYMQDKVNCFSGVSDVSAS